MFPFKWGKHRFFRWWTKKPNQNFSKLFWTTSSCHVCWTLTTSLKEYLSFHFRQKEITAATCYQPLLYLNSFHDHPLWYQYNDAFPPPTPRRGLNVSTIWACQWVHCPGHSWFHSLFGWEMTGIIIIIIIW